jgi:hypothetical protein
MKKQIGLAVLAVFTALTIGFAPALAQASQSMGPTYLGQVNIPGTVERSYPGYVLKSSEGTFRLAGANASEWVGQKVKAFGQLTQNEGTDVETITVDQFVPMHG